MARADDSSNMDTWYCGEAILPRACVDTTRDRARVRGDSLEVPCVPVRVRRTAKRQKSVGRGECGEPMVGIFYACIHGKPPDMRFTRT